MRIARPRGRTTALAALAALTLVAAVLNQEMFITLHKALRYAHDNKEWENMVPVMRWAETWRHAAANAASSTPRRGAAREGWGVQADSNSAFVIVRGVN